MVLASFSLAFLLLLPAITLYGEKKYRILQWIGAIVICYLSGILLGNLPFVIVDHQVFNTASELSVSLAIPSLLFSTNLLNIWRYAKPALFSFSLCTLAVCISATAAHIFMASEIEEAWKVSGMLIGVYTGGTPNMSAIGKALGVQDAYFILINSADIVLSGLYFIFLITIGPAVLKLFLPAKPALSSSEKNAPYISFSVLPLKTKFKNVGTSLLLSFFILMVAAGISFGILGTLSAPMVILSLTTLGFGASFIPQIRNMEGSYQTAHYLLLVFALSIGVMADFSQLLAASAGVFGYCAFTMLSSVLLHYLMAAAFRIEADIVLITSTAAIFGPAFIGPVANNIGNRQIIAMGITTGMLGYGLGNYLGIAIGWLLE